MTNSSGCGNCKTCDHGENGSERNCGNQRHEDGTTKLEGQQRSSSISSTWCGNDAVWTDQCRSAVTKDQGHQVERTNEDDSPGHRLTCFLGGRNGVEAHQNVWQTSGSKTQSESQGDEVQLSGQSCTVLQTRLQDLGWIVPLGGSVI